MSKKKGFFGRLKAWLSLVIVLTVALAAAGYAVLSNLDVDYLRALMRDGAREATGRELVVAGDIRMQVSLEPRIVLEDVRFENADWASQAEMLRVDRFELEVALLPLFFGDIRVQRLILRRPEIFLERTADGRANWEFGAAAETETETETETESGGSGTLPSVGLFLIEDGRVTFIDGAAESERSLDLARVTVRSEGLDAPLTFEAKGNLDRGPFELSGQLGALSALTSGERFPLSLKGRFAAADLALQGFLESLDDDLLAEADFRINGESLAGSAAAAGFEVPEVGAFHLAGRVKGGADKWRLLGLDAELGESDLSGSLEVDLGEDVPAISGSLLSRNLDIASLAAGAAEGGSDAAAGSSPYVFPAVDLPLDLLGMMRVSLELEVARLTLQKGLVLEALEARLEQDAGGLALAPLSAVLAGGPLDGEVTVTRLDAGAKVRLSLGGEGIDYGRLLHDMGQGSSVSGVLDLATSLEGQGGSPRDLAASLNGDIRLESWKGRIEADGFKLLTGGLGGLSDALTGQGSGAAEISCARADFRFTKGVGRPRALVLATPDLSVSGGGQVDLRDETLKLDFETETQTPSLASLALPFQVRGTLKNPSVQVDPLAAATGSVEGLAEGALSIGETASSLVTGLLGGDDNQSSGTSDPCQVAARPAAATAEPAAASEPAASEPAASTGGTGGSTSNAEDGTAGESTSTSSSQETNRDDGDKSLDKALDDLDRDFNKVLDLFN